MNMRDRILKIMEREGLTLLICRIDRYTAFGNVTYYIWEK